MDPKPSLQSEMASEEADKIFSVPLKSSLAPVVQLVKPETLHEGYSWSCPIPGDASNIKSVELPIIEASNRTKEKGVKGEYGYDQSFQAQKMMKGEDHNGHFTHISIPFSSSSPMKGAYICLLNFYAGVSFLIFTFSSSMGEKISKKYKFPEFEGYLWYFLPVDLPDVILCEITGEGREKEDFEITSLVFIREETPEETLIHETKKKLWSEALVVKSEFVKEGDNESQGRDSIPIPRDDPTLFNPSIHMVKCKDDAYSKESKEYDQSSDAQKMLKGEDYVQLSHLSIPFPSPSPMKGAYICVDDDESSPSLLFTFTDSYGKKTFKKYEFKEPEHSYEWHFLPIDLSNIVLCEIDGKGTWKEEHHLCFEIFSLVFFREETSEETLAREARAKLWSEAPVVKPEFVKEGDKDSIPIPRDDPSIIGASFAVVKGKNDSYCQQSEEYDQSLDARKMLMGDSHVSLSHLSIPFPSPSPMKGAYICVDKEDSLPSLLFTFTNCDGTKTSKKYEFVTPKHEHEWHFLPIDLYNVVLCEIEGKCEEKKIRRFKINSLIFTMPEEIITAEQLAHLPWK
ncbi:hypothetical protein ADUPG1_007209 [Aduncisulcus paluster]|uniref:NudC domain-containing protein 1 n=1 Tax=Aduncisulcus paluster TaxID=2918883 RepID=A0ABQ5KMU5_9EUKA|nr:hypothetical protein ADUPG1_007209 [Aduncisulcus paluster]